MTFFFTGKASRQFFVCSLSVIQPRQQRRYPSVLRCKRSHPSHLIAPFWMLVTGERELQPIESNEPSKMRPDRLATPIDLLSR